MAEVKGNSVFEDIDGSMYEFRYVRAESGKWHQLMFDEGEWCGEWLGDRCVYGVKTDSPWIRSPFTTFGKVYLEPEHVEALRNAMAGATE